MKKIIAFFMVIAFCLSLVSCGAFGGDSEYTLESLREEYRSDMLAHARSLVSGEAGKFEVVILEKEETIKNLQGYTTDRNIDMDKIEHGLFVKFSVTSGEENIHTVYFNYGLEFSQKQKKDIRFSKEDASESWLLEVVKENKCLVFEYSIVEPLR